MFIPDPDLDLLPISDPGSRGSGSGSVTLVKTITPLNVKNKRDLSYFSPLWFSLHYKLVFILIDRDSGKTSGTL
jgi:hypothetical protein